MEFSTCGLFLLVFAPTSAFYLLTFLCWHFKLTEKLPWQFSSFRTLHHPGPQGYHPVQTTSVQRSKLRNQHWSTLATKAQSLCGFHLLSHPVLFLVHHPVQDPQHAVVVSPSPPVSDFSSGPIHLPLSMTLTLWKTAGHSLYRTCCISRVCLGVFMMCLRFCSFGPNGAEVRCLLRRYVMSLISGGDSDDFWLTWYLVALSTVHTVFLSK